MLGQELARREEVESQDVMQVPVKGGLAVGHAVGGDGVHEDTQLRQHGDGEIGWALARPVGAGGVRGSGRQAGVERDVVWVLVHMIDSSGSVSHSICRSGGLQ